MKNNKIWTYTAWGLCVILLAFLISNRHRNSGTFNWMTPLWADQAGYYVYLPSLFVYQFDANEFPEGIEAKTGDGFSLNRETGKVITRYSSGVAIMQAPFFLIIHAFAGFLEQPQDGFSGVYHEVPNLAALFYTILGFIFLWRFLRFYYRKHIVFFTLTTLFFGTNLYYYAVDSTGMSHVYSFSLFAVIAWVTHKMLHADHEKRLRFFILWYIVFSLIVLVRPTNVLIFPFLFTLGMRSFREIPERIRTFVTLKNGLVATVVFILVFIPQFIYWKYVSGSYLYYSYEGYGFSNLTSPKILELWFSPVNGMFLYSPLYLLILVIMIVFVFQRGSSLNTWVILFTFFGLTYLFASWFVFSFGCGYGSRNFVEYTVMFALPVAQLFRKLGSMKRIWKIGISFFVVFLVYFNMNLVYAYNRCFQGEVWDFQEYISYMITMKKYHHKLELADEEHQITPEMEFSKKLILPARKAYYVKYDKAVVDAEIILNEKNSGALLVLTVESPDSMLYFNSILLRDQIPDNKLNQETHVMGEFHLPVPFPTGTVISAYIWNKEKEMLQLKNLKLLLE